MCVKTYSMSSPVLVLSFPTRSLPCLLKIDSLDCCTNNATHVDVVCFIYTACLIIDQSNDDHSMHHNIYQSHTVLRFCTTPDVNKFIFLR